MSKHKLNLATLDTPQQQHPIKKAKPNPPAAAQQQQQPTWMGSANLNDMQAPLAAPFDMFGSNTINMSMSNDTADWLTSPQKPPTTTTTTTTTAQPPQPSSSTSLGALKPQTPFTKVAGNKQPQFQPQQQPQQQPIKSPPAPFSNNINPYPQQPQQQQFQQTNSLLKQYRPPQQHQEQQQSQQQQQLNGNQLDVLSLPLKDVEQQIENERARLADLICARSQLLQTREALLSQLQDVYRMD